jgi:hypothetical protein
MQVGAAWLLLLLLLLCRCLLGIYFLSRPLLDSFRSRLYFIGWLEAGRGHYIWGGKGRCHGGSVVLWICCRRGCTIS